MLDLTVVAVVEGPDVDAPAAALAAGAALQAAAEVAVDEEGTVAGVADALGAPPPTLAWLVWSNPDTRRRAVLKVLALAAAVAAAAVVVVGAAPTLTTPAPVLDLLPGVRGLQTPLPELALPPLAEAAAALPLFGLTG